MDRKASLSMLALAAVVGFGASGCAIAAPGLVTGGIYSGYTVGAAANNDTPGAKQGEACAMSILGIVGLGDASVGAAKQAGSITKVASVDHKAFNILGLYGNVCTVVKGD
jgi:hypothetical protein